MHFTKYILGRMRFKTTRVPRADFIVIFRIYQDRNSSLGVFPRDEKIGLEKKLNKK